MNARLTVLLLTAAALVLCASACNSNTAVTAVASFAPSPVDAGIATVWPVPTSLDMQHAAQALRETSTYGDGVFARYFADGAGTNPRGVRVILVPGDQSGGSAYRVQWNDWSGTGWSRGRDVATVEGVFAKVLTLEDTEYQLWVHRASWRARGVDSGWVVDPRPQENGQRGAWLAWDQAVSYLRTAKGGEGVWTLLEGNGNQFRHIRVPADVGTWTGVRYLVQVLFPHEDSWRAGTPYRDARTAMVPFFQGCWLYKLWSSSPYPWDSTASDEGGIVEPTQVR